MAAPTAWRVYREFKKGLGEKLYTLNNSDVIKCALYTSTSTIGDVTLTDVNARYTATNEVANQGAPGYATGGKTCTTVSWVESAGTVTFDMDDISWTATGGNLVARFAVLYNDTSANKDLICYCILDSTPADVTVTTGNTLTIQINASGVFTVAGGEA